MQHGRQICNTVLAATLIICSWIWYVKAATSGELYGPFSCEACHVGSPNPDPITSVFLTQWEAAARRNTFAPINMVPGDKIMICNAGGCVTYTKTDSGNYFGGKPEQQTSTPSNGGAGGIGSGSGYGRGQGVGRGGGADLPSGSHGGNSGKTGAVTVGPLGSYKIPRGSQEI